MATVAIIGCAGYTGQETLDRVIAHPELEAGRARLRLARREAGVRTRPAARRRRAPGVRREWGSGGDRRGRVLPLHGPRAGGAVRAARGSRRGRPLGRAPAPRRSSGRRVGYGTAPRERGATALPELYPPHGPLIANPGCYATAALLALGPVADLVRERGRRREVGRLGRRPDAQAELARGQRARELRAVRGRRAPPRARDRPAARIPRLLRPAPASGSPRPARDVLRRAPTRPTVRDRLEEAYADSRVVRVLPEGVVPELARVQGTDAAEVAVFEDGATGTRDRRLRARQPRQGGCRAGAPEREHRARPRRDGGPSPARSARMSVTAADGFVASGVHAGIRRRARDLALVRSLPRATGAAMFTVNRVQAAPVIISKAHLELAEPQAVVVNSGVANAATGERGELDALATAAEAARLLHLDPEEVLVLSTGVIGAPLPLDRTCARASSTPRRPSAGRRRRGGRGDPHHRHALEGGRLPRGRLRRRRDGEGERDDPPEPRDDARSPHDRLSARAGRGNRLPPAGVDASFNSISVDGECSTNDTVVLLASGAQGSSGRRRRTPRSRSPSAASAPTSRRRSWPTARAPRCSPRSP